MFNSCSFLFFLLLPVAASSQNISGILLDPDGSPAAFASVRLLAAADSVYLAGTAADAGGRFSFSNLAEGIYRIKASLLGFADACSPVFLVEKNKTATLEPLQLAALNALREVTVSARKALIEYQPDKIVVNVEGSALAAGNSAYELLQRSPGVVITPQDAILLNGKGGVLVLIDGRPTQMNARDLAAFLRATPAESIVRIELVANPSSKYDAEGVAGIIDIRLKKNRNIGLNGSLSGNYGVALHYRRGAGINLNYRPGKINFFGSYNLFDAAQLVRQDIIRSVGNKTFEQKNPNTAYWTTHQFKTGADWFIAERHSLGLLLIGSSYDHTTWANNRTDIRTTGATAPDSSLLGVLRNPEQNRRLNYNLNYRFADTLGAEWTLDADRIEFRQRGVNTLRNELFDAVGTPLEMQNNHSDMAADIMVWALKTDFVKTRKNGFKIETGAKITWTDTQNNIRSERGVDDVFTPDPGRCNDFDFQENIAAAYASMGHQSGKWGWQAGLRAERTAVKGLSTDFYQQKIQNPDTAYLGLFPTAFLQYKINDNNQLGLNYGRRISRPAYQDLNPFVWQADPYNSERGNPYLRPAYTSTLEFRYTYKYAASLSLGYSRTRDLVNTIARVAGDQAYTQPENLAQQDHVSININAPLPIRSWWEGYLWLGVWHNRYHADLPDGRLDAGAFGGGCWTGQQIKLPRGSEFAFSFWAQLPTREGMFTNVGIWSLDLAVKQKLLRDKAVLKLAFSDVFNSQRWKQTADFGPVRGTIRNEWESQMLSLSFNWNFGTQKNRARDRNIGAAAENDRIKGGKTPEVL